MLSQNNGNTVHVKSFGGENFCSKSGKYVVICWKTFMGACLYTHIVNDKAIDYRVVLNNSWENIHS